MELANQFECKIEVEKRDGPTINGKSILGVLLLEGVHGTAVRVIATGSDAKGALNAITKLIDDGFGEL